jgi:glycosyltransferase involved in cell wall biosynthesis
MSRVSIGLPVRNGAATIERAIRSALSQTHVDIEVVISDNASDDGTTEICERYASQDPRIKYLRQSSFVDIEENIMQVLANCSGDYCMFMGHDDEISPDYAASLADLLDRHPDAVLAACGVNFQHKGGGYREVRYIGRQAIVELSLFSRALIFATRRTLWRSYFKPNLFVVGLFRRHILAGIWRDQMGWFLSERNILLEAAFSGDFLYCDKVLFTKNTSKFSHVERNPTDAFALRKQEISRAPRRYGCAVLWHLLRSPRVSLGRKALVPLLLPWVVIRKFGVVRGAPA